MTEEFPTLSASTSMGTKKNKAPKTKFAAQKGRKSKFVPLVAAHFVPDDLPAPAETVDTFFRPSDDDDYPDDSFLYSATSSHKSSISVAAPQFNLSIDPTMQNAMSVANQSAFNKDGNVKLPVDDFEQDILKCAAENDVIIVSGDTGSGKSTRVPPFLATTPHHLKKRGAKIFTTQPRRVAAKSLCERVAKELGDVGENGNPLFQRVGYAVGHDRHFGDQAEFVYCTSGWLLHKLINEPKFAECISYLVVDEAHECDADMEILLFYCQTLLQNYRGQIKLVLMSATLNYRSLQSYFPGKTDAVSINMRRFPVQVAHLDTIREAKEFFNSDAEVERFVTCISDAEEEKDKDDKKGHMAGVNHLCSHIYEKLAPGTATTILVFFGGFQDINIAYDMLLESLGNKVELCILHSMIDSDVQMQVFEPLALPKSSNAKTVRIVLSTNIAESSVTIPNVSIVIDLGTHKVMKQSVTSDVMELRSVNISQAAADQRAGRTGRVCNGTVFRFYTAFDYKIFDKHNRSEIQDTPPATTILRFYSLKQNSVGDVFADPLACIANLVDPPSSDRVRNAFDELIKLGALTDGTSRNSTITPFGLLLVQLPLSFEHSEFVLFGCQFHNYSAHFAVMAAFLGNQDLWYNPFYRDEDKRRYQSTLKSVTASRQRFSLMHNSDLLAAVEIFRTMLSFDRRQSNPAYRYWVNDNKFILPRLEQFMATACIIINRLADAGFAGCQNADAALFGRRSKRGAMDKALINSILPMMPSDSKCLSMIISWAFWKNLVNSTQTPEERLTPEKVEKQRKALLARESQKKEKLLNTNDGIFDTIDDPSQDPSGIFDNHIESRVQYQTEQYQSIGFKFRLIFNGSIGNQKPDDIVRLALATFLSPLDKTKTESEVGTLEKFGEKSFYSGSIRYYPQNVVLATHILHQLLNKGSGSLFYTSNDKKNAYSCEIAISNVSAPSTYEWEHQKLFSKEIRVYAYPPRSPFHCLARLEPIDTLTTKSCFLPRLSTAQYAVAPQFTLTGRSYLTPLLSLIPTDVLLICAVVARFKKSSNFVVQEHTNFSGKSKKQYYRICGERFACRLIKTPEDLETAKQLLGPLSESLVEKLRNWTLQKITDTSRSTEMHNMLHKLLEVSTKKDAN